MKFSLSFSRFVCLFFVLALGIQNKHISSTFLGFYYDKKTLYGYSVVF